MENGNGKEISDSTEVCTGLTVTIVHHARCRVPWESRLLDEKQSKMRSQSSGLTFGCNGRKNA